MGGRFNFSDELGKARRALEERVAEYAAEHPAMGYRELCEAFNLSLGTLSSILRRRRKKRNASSATFVVRHENQQKDLAGNAIHREMLTSVVTVKGAASIDQKRRWLVCYYQTEDIVPGDDPSILRRVEYSARELKDRFPAP
jgi:hypothetical protein